MKKNTSKSLGKRYPSVNLYREDIEHIINILSEACGRVKISDDENEYESLDELEKEKGSRPKKITLQAFSPFVSVDLERSSIWLYRASSDRVSLSTFKLIEDLLTKKKNLIGIIFNKQVGIIFSLIFLLIALSVKHIEVWFPSMLSRLFLIIFLLGIPVLSFLSSYGALSSISLKKSHEDRNFFYKNGADIIKIVIGAAVGSLVTWLLTKIL